MSATGERQLVRELAARLLRDAATFKAVVTAGGLRRRHRSAHTSDTVPRSHSRLFCRKQVTDLAEEDSGVEADALVGSGLRAELMHPERRRRRRFTRPLHAWRVEQIDVPRVALQPERLRHNFAGPAFAVPLLCNARI